MPEPNATVDPFDSAGVRLPTEGKGYSGVDSPVALVLGPAFGTPVPTENSPATGIVSVDIPFAAAGEVIEIAYSMGFAPDNTNMTPATVVACLVGVIDSATIPFQAFLPLSAQTNDNILTLADFATLVQRCAWEVPDGLVYPISVVLFYFSDGDSTSGDNTNIGVGPPGSSFMVQRVKRERVLQMPPPNG